ncbi:putative quinol monooxygenase [Microcella sp.]|uniref:putative quinol monooxygenase n=1 Tax=Microcella sp. TaxID=1913979 RepID=UPI002564602D|nr:putative quinol monooxygenase [Microcella sp.]MBX9471471.1 antibiotic biosynthesis monooxygenase [Microcella sp.]
MTNTGVVNVVAVFHPLDGHRDAVVAALEVAIPLVHDEPGCELYVITEADDGRLVMIEKWRSVAELDAHGSSPAVVALVAALDGHLAQPVEVTRLIPLPMGDPAKGEL